MTGDHYTVEPAHDDDHRQIFLNGRPFIVLKASKGEAVTPAVADLVALALNLFTEALADQQVVDAVDLVASILASPATRH